MPHAPPPFLSLPSSRLSSSLVFDQQCLCTGLFLKLVTPQKYWWTKTILCALPPHSPPIGLSVYTVSRYARSDLGSGRRRT